MALPRDAVKEDARLERAASSTAEALMRHRWHWTLDESNPERVAFREYARAVGKTLKTIRAYAHGYVLLREGAGSLTPSEALERSNMGAETQAATEAVAQARGVSFKQARQARPVEVRRVREIGRQRAEERGTTVEEETRRAADWVVKAERSAAQQRADRRERLGLRFVEMEGYLDDAQRKLAKAVSLAHDVPWGDEERELLEATLANVRALLHLIDLALIGAADIDWDGELAALTKEA